MGLLDLHPQLVHYWEWLLMLVDNRAKDRSGSNGQKIKSGFYLNTISLGP